MGKKRFKWWFEFIALLYGQLLITKLWLNICFPNAVIESNDSQHRNELTSFVRFEELLLKYFKNSELFTVVPKIVFLDGNVDALNKFLMRDRPGESFDRYRLTLEHFAYLLSCKAEQSHRQSLWASLSRRCFSPKVNLHEEKCQWRAQRCIDRLHWDQSQARIFNGWRGRCVWCEEVSLLLLSGEVNLSSKWIKLILFVSQYLKLRNKRIHSISSYCPIDLFSGKAERMNRAIDGLLLNPQNNLKMFLDGKIIYNEYSKDKSSFRRALTSLFPEASTEK